jgi:hypothetical protein
MRIQIIYLLALMLVSCDNSIRFEVPQPEGKTNEKLIPKKLIGKYSSLTDSSVLRITYNLVIRNKVINLSTHLSKLDSADRAVIKHDTSYTIVDANMRIEVTIKGDSAFQHMDYTDTIFSNARGDVLRKFKGYYFINHQASKNRWSVTKLARVKNGVTLGTVSKKEDIANLREVTSTKSDSIDNFRPTKKELKKFLKEKGDEEAFIKIE